jgi:putative Mg2+ transporter-C (MgtC) family protein
VITGVGFLGTGLMVWRDQTLAGLTTATGLWISAGIGLAVGFGFYMLGLIATLLTLFIFIVIWFVEQGLKKHFPAIEGAAEQTSRFHTPQHISQTMYSFCQFLPRVSDNLSYALSTT